MKELAATCFLLLLLALPFLALFTDALGKTRDRMLPVAIGVTALSWQLALLLGGSHHRPHVAAVFTGAFFAWPVLLLVAKGWNDPGLSWRSIWLSVPVMSWYLIHFATEFSDRNSRWAGPALNLLLGWLNMFVPFLPLLGLFLGGRAMLRKFRIALRARSRTDAQDSRF